MSVPPRILLVDDDPAGAELTLAALGELGLADAVQIVGDGEEALDYLYQRGAFHARTGIAPEVVLLDLKMPKVDGHEVLRCVRAEPRLRHLRVVILSSSDQREDMRRSDELGSDAYIVKPASIDALIEQLRKLTRLWLPSRSSIK